MRHVRGGRSYDPETQELVRVKRAAHWRNQPHGPDRTLVRRIRIKACTILVVRPIRGNYELPLGEPPGRETEQRKT